MWSLMRKMAAKLIAGLVVTNPHKAFKNVLNPNKISNSFCVGQTELSLYLSWADASYLWDKRAKVKSVTTNPVCPSWSYIFWLIIFSQIFTKQVQWKWMREQKSLWEDGGKHATHKHWTSLTNDRFCQSSIEGYASGLRKLNMTCFV